MTYEKTLTRKLYERLLTHTYTSMAASNRKQGGRCVNLVAERYSINLILLELSPPCLFTDRSRVGRSDCLLGAYFIYRERWGETDGRRFTYPESPLLTQGPSLNKGSGREEDQCDEGNECVHIKAVPLGSTVEIIMFDQGMGPSTRLINGPLQVKEWHRP
ncbi:hypothetical protein EVAR_94279_1 [Eumeta japonica]|uniref:Uncharacterized protein n=1 Tax=Eumeta variegata TaxID=151549 RepID=A0A4C1UEZ9_EUMVA|nr:hypothetical protein EVAR_94279_1 [Eumeta japonica]